MYFLDKPTFYDDRGMSTLVDDVEDDGVGVDILIYLLEST